MGDQRRQGHQGVLKKRRKEDKFRTKRESGGDDSAMIYTWTRGEFTPACKMQRCSVMQKPGGYRAAERASGR